MNVLASIERPSVLPAVSAEQTDAALLKALADVSGGDPNFWSAHDADRRDCAHGLFQYPAMMVPKVQRALISSAVSAKPEIKVVYDPFVGAGTSLAAAMCFGLDVYGQDINPLAILISRLRTSCVWLPQLDEFRKQVIGQARSDGSDAIEAEFPGREKWFKHEVSVAISRLVRAIRKQKDLNARRFLWVSLAETIRLTSNDRTSTFKLHARDKDEIARRSLCPIEIFSEISSANAIGYSRFASELFQAGMLSGGGYSGKVNIGLGDSTNGGSRGPGSVDLLVTSPPYGDNITTVPYGQHSYLPLQWIDFADIDSAADPSLLRTTQEIDRRSLGGRCPRNIEMEIDRLTAKSVEISTVVARLRKAKKDRIRRVISFASDLEASLTHLVSALKLDGYMIWTVGNRTVQGEVVRNSDIISQILETKGVREVAKLERTIKNKRMAGRNDSSPTMKNEWIIIYRKERAE